MNTWRKEGTNWLGSFQVGQRPAAGSSLFTLTARVFSYPSVEWLSAFLEPDCLEEFRMLLMDAFIGDSMLDQATDDLEAAIRTKGVPSIVSGFRAEFTRLYLMPGKRVHLECSWWMRSHESPHANPTTTSKTMNPGERASVARQYRRLGLRLREGLGTPSDFLPNELDFLAYVLQMEATALSHNDQTSAHEWAVLGSEFARGHFVNPARDIVRQTIANSDDVSIVFAALLLGALSDSYESGPFSRTEDFDW